MVSVLPSSALADLFLLSYRLHHLPLYVPKLASVWLGVPGSEESPGIASRDFQFVFIILTPSPSLLPIPPTLEVLPGARSLVAGLGFPDSSVRLRRLGAVSREGVAVASFQSPGLPGPADLSS